jgi:hypothetical protein
MIPATWFRKPKNTPDASPAKDSAPAAEPAAAVSLAAPGATAVPSEEPAKVESIAAPSPETPAAPPLRASRLIEAGRKRSTDLKSRIGTLLAGAEPWGKPAGAAAAILVVGALGYAGGSATAGRSSAEDVAALRWTEASASIRENRDDVARLASELKFVRTALDGLRSDRRGGESTAKQAQLIERSASFAIFADVSAAERSMS